MYKNLSAPLVIQVELTERCPNKCFHCYNYWRHMDSHEEIASLNPSQIDRIMGELERANVFEVVITGGEPLVNKRAVFQILDRVEEKGFLSVTINSSLIGMTKVDAERLSRYRRLGSILTSLMGPNEEIHDRIAGHEGSFRKTVEGMMLLTGARVPVSVNMVVSRLNRDHIKETAALCKHMGVKTFNATRATAPLNCADFQPYSLDLSELREYLSALEDAGSENVIPVGVLTVYPLCGIRNVSKLRAAAGKRCSAGVTVAAISARGEVRACTHIQEGVGNIFSESLSALWDKMVPWRNGSLLPQVCKDCKALAVCGGGCRADAQSVHGSLDAEDPLISVRDVDTAIEEHRALSATKGRTHIEIPLLFAINPDLRWRAESFGSVWFLGNKCAGIFGADTTELLTAFAAKNAGIKSADLPGDVPTDFVKELFRKRIFIDLDEYLAISQQR